MSSQFAIAFPDERPRSDDELEPIVLRADPSCLGFDPHANVLYVADAYGGAIIRIEGESHRRIATIESGGVLGPNRIGGLAVTPHGTLYVSRLGYGQAGAVFRVAPGDRAEPLETPSSDSISPRLWRGGLAYDSSTHSLFSTQFLRSRSGPFDGAVVEIDLVTGTCAHVADGFLHPTGIVKLGPTLVVADGRQRTVTRIDLFEGRAIMRSRLAVGLDRPDAICALGLDSVLVTTYDDVTERGMVHRLWLDGRSEIVADGSWEPRGVATDGERMFVSVRRTGRVLVFRI